jgi:hypothetical protein
MIMMIDRSFGYLILLNITSHEYNIRSTGHFFFWVGGAIESIDQSSIGSY